ncbi:MAG: hypothetical protein JSV91_07855 [Phycisphaerales bacterium]|nr:MAG: hypothetical protein JSV91_07855 [Phycisphaerales bacterium]
MSTRKRSTFFLCLLSAALLTGGCAADGSRTSPISEAPSQPPRLNDEPSQQARDAAEQARRDVDDFLALREEARRNAEDGTDETSPPPDGSSRTGPPPIIWNQPGGSGSAGADPETSRQSEAPFVISSGLFREEPELEEVTDPPPAAGDLQADPLQPDRVNQLRVELSAELRRAAADSDKPLNYLLAIAAMAMVAPDRTLDPETLYDLSEEERELFARLQDFFAEMGRNLTGDENAKDVIAEAVADLREALTGELKLPTAELCYSVTGFGIYKTFNKYAFLAHKGQQVIVYLEIDDFTSELNRQGQWVTELSQLLTIYGDDGLAVWGGRDWATVEDAANKRRRDFFTVQTITLPDALSVGKYTLKIRARDDKTGAEAERTIPFEMVADPKLAAKLPGN